MRSDRTLAAAGTGLLALVLCAPAGAAHAAGDTARVEATAIGSGVRLTTTACPDGGRAALLPPGRTAFEDGYLLDLAPGGRERGGSWLAVEDGRYTVAVRCADGTRHAGGTVRVPGTASPPATASAKASPPARDGDPFSDADPPAPPTAGPASTPPASARPTDTPSTPVAPSASATATATATGGWPPAVRGGLGGSATRESPGSFEAGIALVCGAAVSGLVWFLRRRHARGR